MDKSFVEAISALVTSDAQFDNLLNNPNFASPLALIPDNYALQSTEKFLKAPIRYKAYFTTTILDDFIDYVNDHGSSSTSIFIDKDAMQARAVLDLGTPESPEWGSHNAVLEMQETPEYKALLSLSHPNTRLDQIALCDFLEDWQDYLSLYSEVQDLLAENATISVPNAIASLRGLTLEKVKEISSNKGDFSDISNQYDKLEMKSNRGTIPSYFRMSIQPYESFPDFDFKVNIRMSIDNGNRMMFKFRVVGLDSIKTEISKILHNTISETVREDAVLASYRGTVSVG